MKVTINKDLISELYPIERKDLFDKYWDLMFYICYKKVKYVGTVFFGFKRISLQKICSVNGFLMNVTLKVKRLKNLLKNMTSPKVIR